MNSDGPLMAVAMLHKPHTRLICIDANDMLYFQGQLVPKSYTRSYAWFNIASPNNPESAKLRDLLEKQLTPEQLVDAQKLSLEWADKLKALKSERPN
jgi:hypothetical protein